MRRSQHNLRTPAYWHRRTEDVLRLAETLDGERATALRSLAEEYKKRATEAELHMAESKRLNSLPSCYAGGKIRRHVAQAG
jgi:hypothetical protein